jgi:hypothetical protein
VVLRGRSVQGRVQGEVRVRVEDKVEVEVKLIEVMLIEVKSIEVKVEGMRLAAATKSQPDHHGRRSQQQPPS